MVPNYLEQHKKSTEALYREFNYKEDWRVYPIQDMTGVFWYIPKFYDQELRFSDTIDGLGANTDDDAEYSVEVKRVFTGNGFTMLHVDTHTDGNQFLYVLDNKKYIDVPEA